ncbi:hypothetical protein F2P81_005156 [Scophthalmus maximus]|uniref:tRNA (guanine(26)-N(2))-dimethyltransferase n=1 Tax=Scophthalmus maximus TaxID=52904 RepID=A0A6A4TEI6_SCOMX|nr:hypothetical protein F2P81_005156 [Scophthalmus maximus]
MQKSKRDEMKAWMSVSDTESASEGQSLDMFLRQTLLRFTRRTSTPNVSKLRRFHVFNFYSGSVKCGVGRYSYVINAVRRIRAQFEFVTAQLNEGLTAELRQRHVSIQTQLDGLETLVDLNGAGRKSCPLCPEEKFKACYSHKLRRHLQNLHWKVYVEFEGQRMCICHLPCRNLKPGGDQLVRRYRHLYDRSVREYKDPQLARSSWKEIASTLAKDDVFCRKLWKNLRDRQLVFCSLAVLAEERNPLECLDAFGATGIMGLQWAKHLRTAVKVTITDISDTCVKMIKENCQLNHIRWRGPRGPDGAGGEVEGTPIALVEVAKMDANVIMHLRPFDFIHLESLSHLDPFGTAVNYLDAAFRNVRNLGIISVTSTDTGSLYAKSPNVTLRHYGCNLGVVFLSAVECGVVIKTLQSGEEAGPDQSGKRKSGGEESGSVLKKLKSDASLEHPPFYYSIHRHSIRGMNMPKLNRFLQYLTDAGFRVSRTHFDPTGVRTDASLEKFKSVLTKYSVPTYTNATAAETSVSSEKTE